MGRYCTNCGAELDDEDHFSIKSGKDFSDDFEFCPYCGYKIERRACPKCLTIYEEDFTHCPKCGLRLCTTEEFEEIVALTKKAQESYENKDYKGAIDCLKTQLEYYPNPEEILFLLGDCYYCLNDYDNANHYLDKLIEINPNHENLWLKKAQIALAQKDYNKEEEYCLKEISAHQNNKDAYLLLMDCYSDKKEYEKLDSVLEDLSKLDDGKDYLLQVYFLLGKGEDGETEETNILKEKIKNALL